ncbi:MAG: hypothetical protein EA391_05620 [Balneolaceae bacterium]|nr:MAG: hypothetical protein EA391_05620 [Balneolaceae bacterium]
MVRKMIQKIIRAFTALLLLLLSIFGFAEAQSRDDAYSIDQFNTSSGPEVLIKTSGGFVNVVGHDEDYVEVLMFVRRGNRYLPADAADLSNFDINIFQDGDTVTAEAEVKRPSILRGVNRMSISFKVYAPYMSAVNGRTSGGSVSAEHIYNSLQLRTSGGGISVNNLEGDIALQTSGGSITLEEISGNIDARTSGGNIRANGLEGVASLRTSGGSVRLQDISAKLSARTSGGSIQGTFTTFYDDIELKTSGGNINIEIPQIIDYNLQLRANRVNAQLTNFTGEAERNYIRGQIGEGGPLLSARTSGGNVTLSYK